MTELTEQQKTRKTKIAESKAMRGALHLYLSQVAHEANNQGLTLQDMVKVIKQLEIRPNTKNLKETFAKPYALSAFGVDSTEKLDSEQVTELYDALNKVFSYYWHIHLPFPSRDIQAFQALVDSNN